IAAQAKGVAAPGEAEKPPPFTFSFYPHDSDQVKDIAGQLSERGITLKVTADGEDVTKPGAKVHKISDEKMKELKNLAEVTTKAGSPGLLFRPAVSYKVSLTYSDPASGLKAICTTQQFILPDPTRLYVMRYDRMAFVKKVREVGFTDGMLTDFHQ